MSLPYDFWTSVENKLKHVLYGDSVAEYSKTIITLDSEIMYIDFGDIWDLLINNKFEIELKDNHEYIYLDHRVKILSYDVNNDKLIMKMPLHIMRHRFKGNLIRLNLTNMTSIDVTKNHSLIEYRDKKLHKISPEKANYVAVCRNNLYLDDFKYEILPFLFGLWLSNGSLTYAQNTPYASFSFCEKDLTVQKIKDIDIDNKIVNIYNKTNWDILLNYSEFTELLLDYNYDRLNSPDRSIHVDLKSKLKTDCNLFISFIIGYYIGDGSYTTNLISFSTASLQLADDIVELFMYYGIYSHIICDKNGRRYKGKIKGDMYTVKVVGMPINILNLLKTVENLKGHIPIEEHSLYYGKGNSPLNGGCIVRKKFKCEIYNIKPVRIQSKEEIEYDGYVYDFEVPETHNFIIDGILVHNTDSIYIELPIDSTNIEESMRISQEIAIEINDLIRQYLNQFILSKMNIEPQYNFTFFKTELTAHSIIFLETKKNYAFKASSIKNKVLPKPKVEYVGIPIVKVNTPIYSSDFIRELVEELALTDIAREDIQEKLNEIGQRMYNLCKIHIENLNIEQIGSPGKWNSTEKKDNSHVMGMRLYNSLTNTETFKPMSSGLSIGIKLNNLSAIEQRINQVQNLSPLYYNAAIGNINFISIPYEYNSEDIKELFNTYGIYIDQIELWQSLYNTVAKRIVETIKKYAGIPLS